MDGVESTYEALRCQPFSLLRQRLRGIRTMAPFGINYVVNSRTVVELAAAVSFAVEMGAAEFLLLPEQPSRNSGGIDDCAAESLRHWVSNYRGTMRLTVSEVGADGLPVCNPTLRETGLDAYAHIDASGVVKQSSYSNWGIDIGAGNVMSAIDALRTLAKETNP